MTSDPISDMLTRIRNAYHRRKTEVVVPYSNFKHNVAKVLLSGGWISNLEVKEDGQFQSLLLGLKYDEAGEPILTKINRVSKPGQRVYRKTSDIPKVLGGLGTMILSTSKGVMTDAAARQQKVGGEIICEIW